MQLIDSHTHLDDKRFDRDVARVIQRAQDAGIEHLVTIGDRLSSSRKAVALSHRYSSLSATVGVHPHHAKEVDEACLVALAKLADDPVVVAIGEIGLDYHYGSDTKNIQNSALRAQLDLAIDLGLPMVIHCRNAADDLLKALKSVDNPYGGIIHCFSGNQKQAKEFIKLGYLIGVGGAITFSNAGQLRKTVSQLPIEKIVLETDAPYLTPLPKRGRRNEPAFIKYSAHKLAELFDLSIYDVARATRCNAIGIYRLPIDLAPALAYRIRDSIYLNITNACTNQCTFCGSQDDWQVMGHYLKLPQDPTVAELIDAIGDTEKYTEAVFGGIGEPTFRLDVIKEMAGWLHEQGLKVRLNTNGHGDKINNGVSVVKTLKGLIDEVTVSLNVSSDKRYISLCRPLSDKFSYQAVKEFILEAKNEFPKVTATAVDLPNVDLKACRKIAEEELGVEFHVREYFDLA